MNDFDRLLETQLRHMLDPVVAIRPPVRGRRLKALEPVLAVGPPESAPVALEAVPVTVTVTSLPQR